MYDSKRTVAVLLATLTVVGFAVAPTAVVAAEDDALQTESVTNDTSVQADHGPVPHEICTDLLGMIHEEAPYDMLVWVDDLPDDLQPPGVPWTVITPGAVAGIVVAVTPNQCEVQDPNDPSWDPTRDGDNLDPDGGADVQPGENGEVLVIVNGTLDNTSEGPAGVAEADLELGENGTLDPNARLNDGEKEYGVDPGLQYWPDGTTYFETDVYVFGSRLGVEQDCFGGECNFATRGLPNFVDYPALPAPSDRERPDSGGDSGDGGDGSDGSDGSSDDGSGADDGSGTGGPGADDTSDGADGNDGGDSADGDDGSDGDSDSGDGEGGDGSNDGTGADGNDGGDGGDGNDGDSGDGEGGSSESDANQQQQSADDNQNAQQAAAADGTGLGILVALVVFILGAAAIAPRD